MSNDPRHLQDLFHEALESPEQFEAGGLGAGENDLEGMLFLARELQALGRDAMPDAEAALARARERVLQSLPAAVPQASPQPRTEPQVPFWRRWQWAFAPAMAWAPAMMIFLLSLVILTAVSISASASAMPDSPLYAVKRTTEDVVLRMAPAEKRAEIETAIEQHRAEEVHYLRSKGIRAVVPAYEGEVQGCVGDVCQIGPFQVRVPPEVAAKLRQGDRVRVDIQVQPDGLTAVAIAPARERVPAPTLVAATEKSDVLQPGATIPSRPFDTPAVVRVTPTRKPTRKPVQPPTKRPVQTQKKATTRPISSKPGVTPSRPRKASTATLAPLAPLPTKPPRATRVLTATPAPPRSPQVTPRRQPGVGTATPVSKKRRATPGLEGRRDRNVVQAKKTIRGTIQRAYRTRGRVVWVVIGRYRVYVTRETKIVGKIAVGRRATARIYRKDGRWYATKITVKKASSGAGLKPTPTPNSRRIGPRRPAVTPTPRPRGTLPPARRP
ncbi:MAG TPA: hypothetical protein ENK60_08530 [Anaerolineae bacterium]|nr:hypothetical protein [Anaerolineae bacterium]